jgi:hypothetical protein
MHTGTVGNPNPPVAANPGLFRRLFCRSTLWAVVAILVAIGGALCATLRLLTWFSDYDDEGYMLVSLAHYLKQGHLYTQTFSQYGPFYFYAQGIFFQLLHLPLTHDMGRLVTLVYWVVSSLLAAVFVYRASKSVFLACAAWLSCMLSSRVLANEPGHPQQVVLLLYMLAACLSLPSLPGRYSVRLFFLGCVGAALAFTKVNLGVFYIAGLAHALVCVLPSGRVRSIGTALTLVYAAASPWLLMHAGFEHGVGGYCLLSTVGGIVAFGCGALVRPRHPWPVRAALYSAAGLLAGTLLMVFATSLQGMSVSTLVWGVILGPSRHAGVYYFPMFIASPELLAAFILIAGVVGLRWSAPRFADSRWLDVLRCAVGIVSILFLALYHRIDWVVPLLPLAVIPQSHWKGGAVALFPRLFITDMAVTQLLGAYPVAASQLGVAAAPMLLWAFLCIADGIGGLRAASRGLPRGAGNGLRLDAIVGGAILAALVPGAAGMAVSACSDFPPASRLRGSAWLHLPAEQATQFESIASSVGANCRTLFTMPGMGSFNMWSGVPTPNGWNLTAWMNGLSSDRQAEILRIMQKESGACAILNRSILRIWDGDDGRGEASPLARYVMIDMLKIAEVGEYEIRVNPNRSSPWLGGGVEAGAR